MSHQVRPWLRERLLPRAYESAVAAHPDAGPALAQRPPASAGLSNRPRDGSKAQESIGGGLVQVFRFLTFAKDPPDKEEPYWLVASDPEAKVVVHLTTQAVAAFHRHRRVLGNPVRTVSSLRGAILVLSSVTVELGRPPAHAERFLQGGNLFPFPAHMMTDDQPQEPTNADRRTLIVHCNGFRYLGSAGEEAFWTGPSWLWSTVQEKESNRLVRERLTARLVQQARILAAQQQGTPVTTMSFAPSTSASSWGAELPPASQAPQPSERTRSGKRRRRHRGTHRKGRKSGSGMTQSRSVPRLSAAFASSAIPNDPAASRPEPAMSRPDPNAALIFNPLAFSIPAPDAPSTSQVIQSNSHNSLPRVPGSKCEPQPMLLPHTAPPPPKPSPSLQRCGHVDQGLACESSNILACESSSSSAEASQIPNARSCLATISLHSSLEPQVPSSQIASQGPPSLPPPGQLPAQLVSQFSSGTVGTTPASVQLPPSMSVTMPTISDPSRNGDPRVLSQDPPLSRERLQACHTFASQHSGSLSTPPLGQDRSSDESRSQRLRNRPSDGSQSQELLFAELTSTASIWITQSSGRIDGPSQHSQGWESLISSGGAVGPATPNRSTEGDISETGDKSHLQAGDSGAASSQSAVKPSSSPPSPAPSASTNASHPSFDFETPPQHNDVHRDDAPMAYPTQPQASAILDPQIDQLLDSQAEIQMTSVASSDIYMPMPPSASSELQPASPEIERARRDSPVGRNEIAPQTSKSYLGNRIRSPSPIDCSVGIERRAVDSEIKANAPNIQEQQTLNSLRPTIVPADQPNAPRAPDWDRIRADAQARLERLALMRRRRHNSRQENLHAIEQCHQRLAGHPP